MIWKMAAMAVVGLAIFAGNASAILVFQDDFNSENGSSVASGNLNYTGWANWSVSDGTVDLIGKGADNSTSFNVHPGNGLYVDLDGSTHDSGVLTANIAVAPGTYLVTFSLGGNRRNGSSDRVDFTFGDYMETFILSANAPLAPIQRLITVTVGGAFSFANVGNNSNDNQGPILDNVSIDQRSPGGIVPEPASFVVFGIGALGLALARRRQKKAAA